MFFWGARRDIFLDDVRCRSVGVFVYFSEFSVGTFSALWVTRTFGQRNAIRFKVSLEGDR